MTCLLSLAVILVVFVICSVNKGEVVHFLSIKTFCYLFLETYVWTSVPGLMTCCVTEAIGYWTPIHISCNYYCQVAIYA